MPRERRAQFELTPAHRRPGARKKINENQNNRSWFSRGIRLCVLSLFRVAESDQRRCFDCRLVAGRTRISTFAALSSFSAFAAFTLRATLVTCVKKHEWQQSHFSCALDGNRDHSLLTGIVAGLASGLDLSSVTGQEPLEHRDILIVDIVDLVDGQEADLLPTSPSATAFAAPAIGHVSRCLLGCSVHYVALFVAHMYLSWSTRSAQKPARSYGSGEEGYHGDRLAASDINRDPGFASPQGCRQCS